MLSFELRPLSVTLTFDGHCWTWLFHIVLTRQIFYLFQNNFSTSKGDMERTRKVNGRTDGRTDGQGRRTRQKTTRLTMGV